MNTTTALTDSSRKIIEVSGEGMVAAAPDRALITLGAITEKASLSEAQTENAAAVSGILQSLFQLGIPKEKVQTVQYGIEIQYNYKDGVQMFRGYKVTHLLRVTADKIEQTGVIVDTAVRHGANTVSGIQFASAHPETYYHQALTMAVHSSRQKAATLAKAMGVALHPTPLRIQEMSHGIEPHPYQIATFAAAPSTPIQPGELNISAAVKAFYSYS
ncbi:SIMPL domain-containing protein [Paenibacillus sp. MZ04-78.2]|uniref:SIMPL domain-containing protein n=1 Tax=Paenibacillus sp. MZ04-78.2 TaxID=2962034 RepID=UPI0020B70C14|nr:SIMPL domain-containing protein [Paenibacillus sp. MZ04-78.2]MCP3772992.1 SIMPL domain-containing protein [Paenibacillus sp. MZ04-78.2]